MSHNITEVNNQKPNASGVIQLSLDNIITISSPTSGQVLQKSASDWKTGTLNKSLNGLLNYYDDYGNGNSAYTYDVEDNYISRKVSGEYNKQEFTLTEATNSTYKPLTHNTSWTMAYKILSADYPSGSIILFRAVIGPWRASNSNITVQWYKGSPTTGLSSNTPIGNKAYSDNDYGAAAFGLFECDGSDTWAMLRVVGVNGNVSITTGYMSRIQQITAKQLN